MGTGESLHRDLKLSQSYLFFTYSAIILYFLPGIRTPMASIPAAIFGPYGDLKDGRLVLGGGTGRVPVSTALSDWTDSFQTLFMCPDFYLV